MLQAALNAFKLPDLRKKLLFTLGILVVYRFAASIPVPGIDSAAFNHMVNTYQIFQLLQLFSGSSGGFSIVSMGVYPYITAQIAIQILMPVIPRLEEISREGEAGRTKLNQITRLVTIPLAALQAYGQGVLLTNTGQGLLTNFGFFGGNLWSTLGFMTVLTSGTMLLIWLGEMITESGVGNGVSLIIFSGIIAKVFGAIGNQVNSGDLIGLVGLGIAGIAIIAAIVYVQEAQRRIPVQYARRVVRGRMTQAQSTHIPLRVNSAGMIPLIFAFSIVTTPAIIASYISPTRGWIGDAATWIQNTFNQTSNVYWLLTFLFVFAFTYFYTTVQWQQQKLSENLQKNGGFIPGYRPGKHTEDYLNRVLQRITLGGALFLSLVAILPFFAKPFYGNTSQLPITSTALLIVVAVVLDTMKQLEAQLMMRNYQSFIR